MLGTMQLSAPMVVAMDTGQLHNILESSPNAGNKVAGFVATMDLAIANKKKADEKKETVVRDRYGQVFKIIASNESAKIASDSQDSPPPYTKGKEHEAEAKKDETDYDDLINKSTIDFRV